VTRVLLDTNVVLDFLLDPDFLKQLVLDKIRHEQQRGPSVVL